MATQCSASRFIWVPDGPKVGFLFLAECASLPLNVLITDLEMTDYIPMPRAELLEIWRNLYAWQWVWGREICENSSVPRHFLTNERGLYYLTPVGPISVHATSLGQAEQLTYVGSITRMITHFVSRVDYTGGPWRVRFKGEVEVLFTSPISFAWHIVISLALDIYGLFKMVFDCL